MPTGYTAAVGEGKINTLNDFAMICARGMGACVTMRDEPLSAGIPDRLEADTKYHDDKLAESYARRAEFLSLSNEECDARAKKSFDDAYASFHQYRGRKILENARYMSMLDKVRAWNTEAEGIKEFMVQQLTVSIDDYEPKAPKQLSGREWLEAERAQVHRDIEYHSDAIRKEKERTSGRNEWLSRLRASLSVQP